MCIGVHGLQGCAGIHERAEESAQGARQEVIPSVIEELFMKKCAVIFSCALIGFVCVFAKEDRAAGQGKAAAQAKKTPMAEAPLPQGDKEKIRAHVKYLSSDEMEGRGAGARGGGLAADYIGKQFALYGLKPAGDNGTFFHEVPMGGGKTLPDTTLKILEGSGKTFHAKKINQV